MAEVVQHSALDLLDLDRASPNPVSLASRIALWRWYFLCFIVGTFSCLAQRTHPYDMWGQHVLKERLHGHVTTGEAGFEMAPTSATQCQIDAGLFRLALISQKGNKLCT